MSAIVLKWLPAATPEEREAAVADAVQDLLRKWLCDGGALRCRSRELPAAAGLASGPFGLSCADPAALGRAACGDRGDPANERDRTVLARLGEDMVADLGRGLEAVSGPSIAGEQPTFLFELEPEGGTWMLQLLLAPSALVELRRLRCGAAAETPVEPLEAAIACERVALGCHLGTAGLTAGEIVCLEPGDVIVLDTALADPLGVTVDSARCARSEAVLETGDAGTSLRLRKPINLKKA